MSGSRIMWVLWFLLNVIPITCKGELKYISSFFDYKVSYHNLASATIYRRRFQMNIAANRGRKKCCRFYALFLIFYAVLLSFMLPSKVRPQIVSAIRNSYKKNQIVQPSFIDGKQLMYCTLKLVSVVAKYL